MTSTSTLLTGLCLALACNAVNPASPAPAPPAAAAGARANINARFLDPNMEAQPLAQSFEDAGREVYARRADVIRELGLAPGMAIADIGAGSGFYAELMARAVGPSGKLYAQELAPRWIDYLSAKAKATGLTQMVVVKGDERTVNLPENSIDIAFCSDVYHHFEYPRETLASIHRALRPGGALVVLDYDRIEGVTPPSRMAHLRLGKREAIAEIVANGFTLEREPALGLKENYLVIFRRR